MRQKLSLLRRWITFYILWPAAFLLGSLRPVDRRLAVFAYNKNYTALPDNMTAVKRQFASRGWTCVEYGAPQQDAKRFFADLRFQFLYARSAVVFVTDTFEPIYAHKPRRGSRNVQLWHACGAFKKFGYSTLDSAWGGDRRMWELFPRHNTYTDVMVSAPKIAPCYAEAFNCDAAIVRPLGTPRTDVFFDPAFVASGREKLLAAIPAIGGRKVLLYAPTFRGDTPAEARNDDALEFETLRPLAAEYAVVLKYHPFTDPAKTFDAAKQAAYGDFVYLCPPEIGIDTAMCAADLVVTDYSSLIFEYALLERPMLFYAYDLDDYAAGRSWYFPYRDFVPGQIVATTDALLAAVQSGADTRKTAEFRQNYMSACDGHSAERIVNFVIKSLAEQA